MVADNGGAPCIAGDLLSLAICKLKIRRSATVGALIFGFGGKAYEERLIYVAQVTGNLDRAAYYSKEEYAMRPDCIYRVENGRPVRKATANYHKDSDQRERDVGLRFEKSHVLLSSDFRYLGIKGTGEYKERFPRLRDLVENLKQGHRRQHSPELRAELLSLKTEIWNRYRCMKVGTPTDRDTGNLCNGDDPSVRC